MQLHQKESVGIHHKLIQINIKFIPEGLICTSPPNKTRVKLTLSLTNDVKNFKLLKLIFGTSNLFLLNNIVPIICLQTGIMVKVEYNEASCFYLIILQKQSNKNVINIHCFIMLQSFTRYLKKGNNTNIEYVLSH